MGHDVFISYSSHDKKVADAACALLEQRGYRCWIAPRDIHAGMEWGKAIVEGIRGARVFVLIFSANANRSPQVNREVERAVSNGLPIIPFRIEDVAPSDSLEYFISNQHWLDALTPPLARHLNQLGDVVGPLLGTGATPPAASVSAAKPRESERIGVAGLAGMGIGMAALIAAVTWLLWNPYSPTTPAANVADNQAAPANELVAMAPAPPPRPLERLKDLMMIYFAHPHSRVAAASSLNRALIPVSISGLTPPNSEVNLLQTFAVPGWEMIRYADGSVFLALETYENRSASFTMRFSQPVAEFRFAVPGLVPHGAETLTFPAFSATAFDDDGNVVATASGNIKTMGPDREPVQPERFSLTAPGARIRTIRFDANGVISWSASVNEPALAQSVYQALLIEELQVRRVAE